MGGMVPADTYPTLAGIAKTLGNVFEIGRLT